MRRSSFFTLAISALAPFSIAAQDTAKVPAPPRHPVTAAWELYNKRMLALADSLPDDAYTTRLSATVKSFDELIGHTIETNFGVCAGTQKVTNPKKGVRIEGGVVTKAELVALLLESHRYCDSIFSSVNSDQRANSDLIFLLSHTSQMGALMEAYVLSHGTTLTNSEAGRRKPSTP